MGVTLVTGMGVTLVTGMGWESIPNTSIASSGTGGATLKNDGVNNGELATPGIDAVSISILAGLS